MPPISSFLVWILAIKHSINAPTDPLVLYTPWYALLFAGDSAMPVLSPLPVSKHFGGSGHIIDCFMNCQFKDVC